MQNIPKTSNPKIKLLSKALLRRLANDKDFMSLLQEETKAFIRVMLDDETAIDEIPGLRKRLEE